MTAQSQGGQAPPCQGGAAPEVEDLQLRLAVAEDNADLVTVDVVAGSQGEVEQAAVVAEDGNDRVLLNAGPVEVEADQTLQLSEGLEVQRFEEVTVS